MIGSIRKHSKWLWIVIATVTIISFVFFMGTPNRNGGGRGNMSLGTIYGQPVTEMDYQQARSDYDFFCLFNYGNWLDKQTGLSALDVDKQIYANIMFLRKAKSMRIAVPDQIVVNAAAQMLGSSELNRAMGNRTGKAVPMNQFIQQLVVPHGLTAADYAHFITTQMTVEQLELSLGLSGAILSPQEASSLYDHQYQKISSEAVFFSASHYLDKVSAPAAAVGEYYTNYMVYYREPDRVQVSYVWLNITNFEAQSKAEWAKTNFDQIIDSYYLKVDPSELGDAKTPEAAKAKIRDVLIKQRAYTDAAKVARDFVDTLFAMTPVQLDNFAAVAKQKSLEFHTTDPFSQESAGSAIPQLPDLAKTAFALTPDSPFSDALPGGDGIYMIGLAAQLPSSMPSFDEIKSRVTHDYEMHQAAVLARQDGSNFCTYATIQMVMGKSFSQVAQSRGLSVVTPAPFSISSQEIPELGNRVELDTFKQAVFTTAPRHASQLIPTTDGGFTVYINGIMPPEAAVKAQEMPQFMSQLRRNRENEAFGLWANNEATRELFPNIPALQKTEPAAKNP